MKIQVAVLASPLEPSEERVDESMKAFFAEVDDGAPYEAIVRRLYSCKRARGATPADAWEATILDVLKHQG
jgi:hypothetical protein